jgi:hypothetical protein
MAFAAIGYCLEDRDLCFGRPVSRATLTWLFSHSCQNPRQCLFDDRRNSCALFEGRLRLDLAYSKGGQPAFWDQLVH